MIRGENEGDAAGGRVSAADDVSGDEVDDPVVGAGAHSVGGTKSGAGAQVVIHANAGLGGLMRNFVISDSNPLADILV